MLTNNVLRGCVNKCFYEAYDHGEQGGQMVGEG